LSLLLSEPRSSTERFSVRIRDATQEEHQRTERSGFISAYLEGRVPRTGFAAWTSQLWFVYEALEDGAEALRDDPVVGPFLDPRLSRRSALMTDLAELLGVDWRDRLVASSVTQAYADRVRELSRTWPGGYIAHHYTRYMGDLSCGGVVSSTAERLYGLTGAGTSFYRFDSIASTRSFRDSYRLLVDTAAWPEPERVRIMAEAGRSFRMTGAMLDDLERTVVGIRAA
jgi:heme oxygenase (biliverdin-producing, ferredoxin)